MMRFMWTEIMMTKRKPLLSEGVKVRGREKEKEKKDYFYKPMTELYLTPSTEF